MDDWGTTFGSRLRWARTTAGLTGEELAQAVIAAGGKATQSRISEWEGDTIPRAPTPAYLAAAVGQPLGWLLTGEGGPVTDESPGPPSRAEHEALLDRLAKVEERQAAFDRWLKERHAEQQATADEIKRLAGQ